MYVRERRRVEGHSNDCSGAEALMAAVVLIVVMSVVEFHGVGGCGRGVGEK